MPRKTGNSADLGKVSTDEYKSSNSTSDDSEPVAGPIKLKRRLQLPEFWVSEPEAWFTHVERCFRTSAIAEEEDMYQWVMRLLPPRVIETIATSLALMPEEKPYTHLKSLILDSMKASKLSRIESLLDDNQFDGLKPSEQLRKTQLLAESTRPDDTIVRELWFKRLPHTIQVQLAQSWESGDLATLAKWADSIHAVTPTGASAKISAVGRRPPLPSNSFAAVPTPSHPWATPQQPTPVFPYPQNTTEAADVTALRRQIEQLRLENASLRAASPSTTFPVCWCHARYGSNARACYPPCVYQGQVMRTQPNKASVPHTQKKGGKAKQKPCTKPQIQLNPPQGN